MLDDEQKMAVHSSQFPLIITANAGSGKTRILLECAVEHIKLKQNASILILAFNRKAVAEIQQKIEKQCPDNQQVTVATFHSFAARLSRKHHSAAGFSKPPTVLSSYSNLLPHAERAWHKAMLHCLASALHMAPPSSTAITAETVATAFARHSPQHHHHHKEHYTCDEMIDHLNDICVKLKVHPYPEEAYTIFKNWAINHQMKPPLSSTSSHYPLFTKAAEYLSLKLKQDAIITLSGLPSTAVHLLKENPTVLEHVRRQYTHVFADEFQDACKHQLELMVLLAPNVTIVGDPKQSIYGFRNALPNALDVFNKMCIESRGYESAVVTLRRNYRSSPPICAFASELLLGKYTKLISARSTVEGEECKTATEGGAFPPVSVVQHQSNEEEAEAIADSIAQGISNRSFLPKNVAILYRCLNSNNNTRTSILVEKALQKRNITYIVAMSAAACNGDASHQYSQRKNSNSSSYQDGKALLTYLKLFADPEDDSTWHAVLTLPHLGLTSEALSTISEMYRESILHQRELSIYNEIILALASSSSSNGMISARDKLKLEQLHSLMVDLSRELSGGLNLQQFIMNIIIKAGLLNRREDTCGNDVENISQGNEADLPTTGCTTTLSISSSPILAAIIEEADIYSAAAHNQQLLHLAHPSLISILHSFLAYLSTDTDIVSEIERASCYDTEMMTTAGSTQGGSCIATTQALASGTLADQNAVIITTIHSAKGLEWKAVYLPRLNKSMLRRGGGGDGDEEDEEDARRAYYEEEARLLHVAATRAEHYLSVSYVQKYYESKEEYVCEMMMGGGSMNVPVVSPLLAPAIEKLKMQPHIMYFKGQMIATEEEDAYYSDDGSIMTFGTTNTYNDTKKEDGGCVESRDRTNTGRVLSSTQVNTTSSSCSQQQQPVAFKYKLASTARGAFKPPRPIH
jgi:superfamily I DNA/RNA helicase